MDLETDYATEEANYIEIQNAILPKDAEAIQEERYAVRTAAIKRTRENLQKAYGERYDYDIVKEAETDVSKALNEQSLKKKSILSQLQRNNQNITFNPKNQKYKSNEFER